jgi:hypothetical protein
MGASSHASSSQRARVRRRRTATTTLCRRCTGSTRRRPTMVTGLRRHSGTRRATAPTSVSTSFRARCSGGQIRGRNLSRSSPASPLAATTSRRRSCRRVVRPEPTGRTIRPELRWARRRCVPTIASGRCRRRAPPGKMTCPRRPSSTAAPPSATLTRGPLRCHRRRLRPTIRSTRCRRSAATPSTVRHSARCVAHAWSRATAAPSLAALPAPCKADAAPRCHRCHRHCHRHRWGRAARRACAHRRGGSSLRTRWRVCLCRCRCPSASRPTLGCKSPRAPTKWAGRAASST